MARPRSASPAVAAVLALALALPGPALADARAEVGREPSARTVVLGLAALAALGLLLGGREGDEREVLRLPQRCLVAWPTAGGPLAAYEADCLRGSFAAASRLPPACALTVRSGGRLIEAYERACLREEGWEVPRE